MILSLLVAAAAAVAGSQGGLAAAWQAALTALIVLEWFGRWHRVFHIVEGKSGLRLRLGLFQARRFPWAEIERVDVVDWAESARVLGGAKVYRGETTRGVEIALRGGRRAIVSSLNPEALAAVVRRRANLAPTPAAGTSGAPGA